ncbi:MAG: transcriptional regulator [Bacteroidota bacterium]
MESLDPVLSSPIRLAVVSTLIKVENADFMHLKSVTNATNGNLSHQIKKLQEAEYVSVEKSFHKNYPKTTVALTKKGRKAFEDYVETMKKFLHL